MIRIVQYATSPAKVQDMQDNERLRYVFNGNGLI